MLNNQNSRENGLPLVFFTPLEMRVKQIVHEDDNVTVSDNGVIIKTEPGNDQAPHSSEETKPGNILPPYNFEENEPRNVQPHMGDIRLNDELQSYLKSIETYLKSIEMYLSTITGYMRNTHEGAVT